MKIFLLFFIIGGDFIQVIINNAEESITKEAKAHGNGALVLVPKRWIGRKVQITLLEEEKTSEGGKI